MIFDMSISVLYIQNNTKDNVEGKKEHQNDSMRVLIFGLAEFYTRFNENEIKCRLILIDFLLLFIPRASILELSKFSRNFLWN